MVLITVMCEAISKPHNLCEKNHSLVYELFRSRMWLKYLFSGSHINISLFWKLRSGEEVMVCTKAVAVAYSLIKKTPFLVFTQLFYIPHVQDPFLIHFYLESHFSLNISCFQTE